MKLTQKQKLESFDAMRAELEKLRLAVYDLAADSKFPFKHAVKVNCGKEIDGDYTDVYIVSISERSMPVYMVKSLLPDGSVNTVSFLTETEVEEHRDSPYMYWRAIRHSIWKIGQKKRVTFVNGTEVDTVCEAAQ